MRYQAMDAITDTVLRKPNPWCPMRRAIDSGEMVRALKRTLHSARMGI